MNRRAFFKTSVFSSGAALLLPAEIARVSSPASKLIPGSAPDWVEQARAQMPASSNPFFQTAGIAPSPIPVIEEVKKHLDFQNRGPVAPDISGVMSKIEPNLRDHLGHVFGARASEVALTHSTSEGINIASWSMNWEAGDEVIISNHEHPANTIPWYNLRDRYGIKIRKINLDAGTNLMDEIRSQLSSKTRMVSISHVSRNNGRAIPTDQSATLADELRTRGIRYHLDGAQGPGCVPFDFHAMGCDYYSTCGHKWLLGPKGVGAFFVREEMLDETLLSWNGAHSHASMDNEGNYELLPAAARFEYGTRALADFAGFDRAVHWMETIGLDRVLDRIDELVVYAIEKAKTMGFGVTSPQTPGDRSGVFVLRLPDACDGWSIYEKLRQEEHIFTSPVNHEQDLRLAIHFFNTREEIDLTFESIVRFCR